MSDNTFDKLPPHSVEAEMSLLACMILDVEIADEVLAMATPEWFYLGDHCVILNAITELRRRGSKIDAVILRDELKRGDRLKEIGGAGIIAAILASVPSCAHWEEYRDRVRECYLYRQAISVGDRAARTAYKQERPALDILTDMANGVAATVADSTSRDVMTAAELFDQTRDELANPDQSQRLISYGFNAIDRELGGMAPGELILIGARPSMGKSTIMRQMALLAAMRGDPVLYVSLEESPSKVGRNVFAWQCGIENKKMRSQLSLNEMQKVDQAAAKLRDKPFFFVWGQSKAERIHSLAASYVAREGVKLVFIDYMQLIDAGQSRGEGEYDKVTRASHAVRRIARELTVATVSAVQLSRETAKREDKRPTMTDIRSSGQIEQDADVILLLHREDYYHLGEPSYTPTRTAELIRAKVRDGERGGDPITLKSNLAFQCFQDETERPIFDEERINY